MRYESISSMLFIQGKYLVKVVYIDVLHRSIAL
uniref:Uncharacterized protein n=1 Tax=Lepeophtheirus salmonis TaxID=72036 RepID=A0A0K2UTT7_LEPSM